MSRVGQEPVVVPSGVEVRIDGNTVTAKGKLGQRSLSVSGEVKLSLEEGRILVRPGNQTKAARTMWGTARTLVNNLVTGVDQGFTYTLEINGVGYRAAVQGNILNLQLGFSHDVNYPIPEGITIKVERNVLTVSGADKQQVGQAAASIRAYRPPEPYKGKGIRHQGEYVRRKEGKKK